MRQSTLSSQEHRSGRIYNSLLPFSCPQQDDVRRYQVLEDIPEHDLRARAHAVEEEHEESEEDRLAAHAGMIFTEGILKGTQQQTEN